MTDVDSQVIFVDAEIVRRGAGGGVGAAGGRLLLPLLRLEEVHLAHHPARPRARLPGVGAIVPEHHRLEPAASWRLPLGGGAIAAHQLALSQVGGGGGVHDDGARANVGEEGKGGGRRSEAGEGRQGRIRRRWGRTRGEAPRPRSPI